MNMAQALEEAVIILGPDAYVSVSVCWTGPRSFNRGTWGNTKGNQQGKGYKTIGLCVRTDERGVLRKSECLVADGTWEGCVSRLRILRESELAEVAAAEAL